MTFAMGGVPHAGPQHSPSPAFIICKLVDDGHSDWCEVVPRNFNLHFSNN